MARRLASCSWCVSLTVLALAAIQACGSEDKARSAQDDGGAGGQADDVTPGHAGSSDAAAGLGGMGEDPGALGGAGAAMEAQGGASGSPDMGVGGDSGVVTVVEEFVA